MENRLIKILIGILYGGCLLIGAWKREWLVIVFLCSIFVLFYCYKRKERDSFAKQFADISDMLEKLLQKKEVVYASSGKDTLYDKIATQIQRIGEIQTGTQKLFEKEREDMKRLLAEISHQLRTPLANMETYLTLLEQTDLTEQERASYLASVEAAEQKICFLVERFMLGARLENRIIQIHKCRQCLKETVAEAVFQVYKKAEKKNISIEIKELTVRENECIPHDKNWICESIYNLLDNSVKYSAQNKKITIWIRDNEMFTEICVEDEGMGIEAGEENEIFKLYYRGKNVSNQEGFGMGLAITREIVRKHDGFLRVKRKERGLAVSVFLPKNLTL